MTSGNETTAPVTLRAAAGHYASADAAGAPLHLLTAGAVSDGLLPDNERRWTETVGFKGGAKAQLLIPAPDGSVAAALIGGGNGEAGEPCGPSELLLGQAAGSLPAGTYRLGSGFSRADLAALAWGLGAYRYRRYKAAPAGTAENPIAHDC